jgi:IclR family transcriptional regulator, acetate operon repressor
VADLEAPQGITVRRTFALLRVLGRMQQPVGVTRLAVEVGIAKTTAHRLLEQMAMEGVVTRRDHKWSLGTGLNQLDRRVPDLGAVAHPRVHALTQATGASVFLYAKSGGTLTPISRSYGRLFNGIMTVSEQVMSAEQSTNALWGALERGQLVTDYAETHPNCYAIATPLELPSGDVAVLGLGSPSRRDVEALKSALGRNASTLSVDMRRLAS